MREEFDRCGKHLPFSLASKLFSASSRSDQVQEYKINRVQEGQCYKEMPVEELGSENMDDLMFKLEL